MAAMPTVASASSTAYDVVRSGAFDIHPAQLENAIVAYRVACVMENLVEPCSVLGNRKQPVSSPRNLASGTLVRASQEVRSFHLRRWVL